MTLLLSLISFGVILSFLVTIHEIGHFVAAKWAKITVQEFGLGYPPQALILFRKWDTVFSLNWFPFGGFVKMDGEDGPTSEVAKTKAKTKASVVSSTAPFYTKSAGQRLVVILAGATVNLIFGAVAFSIVFSILGIPQGAIVQEIAPDSPAAQAQLAVPLAITGFEVKGEKIKTDSMYGIITFVEQHRGQQVTLLTTGSCHEQSCDETPHSYQVYLRTPAETPANQGALGVTFRSEYLKFFPWYEQPMRGTLYGLGEALRMSQMVLMAFKQMIGQVISTGSMPAEIAGPVGIVHQATQTGVFQQGPLALLLFAGILSINLGIMNLLPIPALDGGRAVFVLLEKIVGRTKIEAIESYANYGGMAFLLGLIALVTVRDIWRIFV